MITGTVEPDNATIQYHTTLKESNSRYNQNQRISGLPYRSRVVNKGRPFNNQISLLNPEHLLTTSVRHEQKSTTTHPKTRTEEESDEAILHGQNTGSEPVERTIMETEVIEKEVVYEGLGRLTTKGL